MKRTEAFLRSISSRLAGRPDCRQVEYRISISPNEFGVFVVMTPVVKVFKNAHSRKDADRMTILEWALHKEILEGKACKLGEGIIVNEDVNLDGGKFIYKLSFDKKKRTWIKEE